MGTANDTLGDRSLLVITRYPTLLVPFAFFSMAVFHIPLYLNRKLGFYKLMGCGRNGTFDIVPDLNQWAVMVFYNGPQYDRLGFDELEKKIFGQFVLGWWKMCRVKKTFFFLKPFAGHGSWDGKKYLEIKSSSTASSDQIAVLTRATIRLNRLRQFWGAVKGTAQGIESKKGFVYSVGIGEIPFIKQATFSIWETAEDMKAYAYQGAEHQEVIRRTRREKWYAEELFLRFRLINTNLEKK